MGRFLCNGFYSYQCGSAPSKGRAYWILKLNLYRGHQRTLIEQPYEDMQKSQNIRSSSLNILTSTAVTCLAPLRDLPLVSWEEGFFRPGPWADQLWWSCALASISIGREILWKTQDTTHIHWHYGHSWQSRCCKPLQWQASAAPNARPMRRFVGTSFSHLAVLKTQSAVCPWRIHVWEHVLPCL